MIQTMNSLQMTMVRYFFSLPGDFMFYNESYRNLFVNNNGLISFVFANEGYTPEEFPLNDTFFNAPLIAPYWADVDTTGTGNVWYRQTSDEEEITKVRGIVANAFPSLQKDFLATQVLFIATWDKVGYFFSGTDKTNTFQCVLASDGSHSFVIFLYADDGIQWTTGDASGGINGTGGTPAQAGFDAGNTIDFTVIEGSFTDDIINIEELSNVNWPGMFVFQVNGKEVSTSDEAKLSISPWYGHTFGGTIVKVSGPTFTETDDIVCMFDDVEVDGVYIEQQKAVCVTPQLFQTTGVSFKVKINDLIYEYSTVFYPLSLEESSDADISSSDAEIPTLLFFEGNQVIVNYDPNVLTEMLEGVVVEEDTISVDVKLVEIDQGTGVLKEIGILASEIDNNGTVVIDLFGIDLSDIDICQVSVFIQPTTAVAPASKRALPAIASILIKTGLWSSVFFLATKTLTEKAHDLCHEWASSEPISVGEKILATVRAEFPCPSTVEDARCINSGLQEDSFIDKLAAFFFHYDASTCFRQRNGNERRTNGYGNQCCYDDRGFLIVGPKSGGTVDKVAPSLSKSKHFEEDVKPHIYCCILSNNCDKYYSRRPSDDGSAPSANCDPPAWWFGDPHIVTLDLQKYTFNGKGEFILIETTDNSFSVQGRMVEISDSDGDIAPATAFSAFVAKQNESDTVQIEIYFGDLIALVNGERIDLSTLNEQRFQNVTVSSMDNSTMTVSFSRGEFIKVVSENGILSEMAIGLPKSYKGKTQGLMGSFDGDNTNDLVPKGGAIPLASDSTIQEIHEKFGITWIISDSADSLFTYIFGQEWSIFYSPNFTPAYDVDFANPQLQAEAIALCGEDEFCLFDIAATGRLEIGKTTLQGGLNFAAVLELSKPIICNPQCANGACVANDTCFCSEGYIGKLCETIVYSDCDNSLCMNSGTCQSHAGSDSCVCSSPYSGEYCEKFSDNDDVSIPAIVGGVVGGVVAVTVLVVGAIILLFIIVRRSSTSKKPAA